MIDNTINIEGLFPNKSISDWEEATKKMLKTDDLDRKLIFKSVEGFDLHPLQTKTDFVCELSTFPSEVKVNSTTASFDIDLSKIHNSGGSIIQELSYAIVKFNELIDPKNEINICISLDSLYFSNISKLRALRFLIERLTEESGNEIKFKIHANNSLREQTLFDPWVNMLRNVTSSMAAIIGGADFISSFSYDALYSEMTGNESSSLGLRQSRNHLKILLEESHLGQVKDYSKGSYTIENLTELLITKSWEQALSFTTDEDFARNVKSVSEKRFELVRSRKVTVTGVNNFANPDETLSNIYQNEFEIPKIKNDLFPIRPVSFEFDHLRSKFNAKENPVSIVLFDKEAILSGRINFCQNYFEVVGSKVEICHSIDELKDHQHVIICATDRAYEKDLDSYIKSIETKMPKSIYLAGNFDHKNKKIMSNLFMGQDIFTVLNNFVMKESV